MAHLRTGAWADLAPTQIVEANEAPWIDFGLDIQGIIRPGTPPHRAVTYTMHVPGYLKVGRCTHLARRINDLQCGNPLKIRLLGYAFGDVEWSLHEMLRNCGIERSQGEWFVDGKYARDVLWARGALDARARVHGG